MRVKNIAQLGIKELFSLKADPVLLLLIIYIFSVAVYTVATGVNFEVKNASVAVVDDDNSALSRQITASLLAPEFQPAVRIAASRMNEVLDNGEFVFVLVFPPDFERDLLQGKQPEVQLNVDASAMTQAGNGAVYIQQIILAEAIHALAPTLNFADQLPVKILQVLNHQQIKLRIIIAGIPPGNTKPGNHIFFALHPGQTVAPLTRLYITATDWR